MDTDSVVDTEMDQKHDEDTPQVKAEDSKPTYKSFKKKFRKIKVKFDEAMRLNNEYYMQEQQAVKMAKRLAQENDELLDILLDQNNSAQMPLDKRIDISSPAPGLSPIPPLIKDEDLSTSSELNTPASQAILSEVRIMIAERGSERNPQNLPRSLASLIATVPHYNVLSAPPGSLAALKPDEGQTAPLSYLTADQLDDYLYDLDATIGAVPSVSQPPAPPSSNESLSFANIHSPYNWLRKHVPNIFLQDGEGSEKSHGKPGALRGAGKRASIPAPSKPGALEFVEEDGLEYDASLTSAAMKVEKKRKRAPEEDDGGYHPKLGTPADGKGKKPRTARKKKNGDASEETPAKAPGSRRKAKSKLSSEVAEPAAEPS